MKLIKLCELCHRVEGTYRSFVFQQKYLRRDFFEMYKKNNGRALQICGKIDELIQNMLANAT